MASRSNDRHGPPPGSRGPGGVGPAGVPPEAELAAAVAHELKNRLAGISAGIQLLAAELGGDSDERRRLLAELRAEIGRVDAIALDLLSFAHPRKLHVQPADLRGLVLEVLSGMSVETELARHRLQVSIDEDLVLLIDPLLLEQTIRSLVLDAARALPSGGTISVRGAHSSRNAILEVNAAGAALQPADRGSELELLTESHSLARGLELALARRNVEAHGGRLVLGEGEGAARFRIELPLGSVPTRPSASAAGKET